jgi:RNA-directed DNA polymerase
MTETKPYKISRYAVKEAWERVKRNKGASGADEESLAMFEANLKDNLYKLWNRMSSGSYYPPPVKEVAIPKRGGGERRLGIPTVGDRVAQMVAKMYLEPQIEVVFHKDSYGYRPGRSAHDALRTARTRCWQYDWVIDLDIKGFFDNISHELLLKALGRHCREAWIKLYVKRWLKSEVVRQDGTVEARRSGTPQGGVISPLLANLFLHYAFDRWMEMHAPDNPFERYADDIAVHCKSREEAEALLMRISDRLKACDLELNEVKSKIVYCKDCQRTGSHDHEKFDFLGYEFRPRLSRSKKGHYYVGFLPGISPRAGKSITMSMRAWKLHHYWCLHTIRAIAEWINPVLRGWINYYGVYNRHLLGKLLVKLDFRLLRWYMKKYKRHNKKRAVGWLKQLKKLHPCLFAHWNLGYAAG